MREGSNGRGGVESGWVEWVECLVSSCKIKGRECRNIGRETPSSVVSQSSHEDSLMTSSSARWRDFGVVLHVESAR